MTFSYSPIIQLFDIDDNTEGGTWGDLTDLNLGRLEQACHGVAAISATTTVDYVLDDTAGTGTESHKKTLVISGTQIQDVNVIVPDRERSYVVVNNAINQGGTWNILVKTAAQVGAVTVPSGDRAVIYCDGIRVYPVIETRKFLSVTGGSVSGSIDMASNKINNLADGTSSQDAVSKAQMDAAILASRQADNPVGTIRVQTVSTNPATLLGFGTWVAFGAGRVMLGAGTFTDTRGESKTFSGGDTGGEYRHVQTIAEMVPHTHTGSPSDKNGSGGGSAWYNKNADTGSTGGGQPFNIMQPYIAVYVFNRTA